MSPWLRLYPRAWRERYGPELEELIESEPATLRVWLDLIAGAIDAHANRQWMPVTTPEGGHETMATFLSSCGRTCYSPEAQRESAVIMIASSLALVLLYFTLETLFGDSLYLEALLYSTFNVAFVLSSLPTFLAAYPRHVRAGLLLLGILASYAFFLGVTLLAEGV